MADFSAPWRQLPTTLLAQLPTLHGDFYFGDDVGLTAGRLRANVEAGTFDDQPAR